MPHTRQFAPGFFRHGFSKETVRRQCGVHGRVKAGSGLWNQDKEAKKQRALNVVLQSALKVR